MSTQKIIFAIVGVILLGATLLFVSVLTSPQKSTTQNISSGDMRIWILYDDASKFQEYIADFKESFPVYKNKNIFVDSFDDLTSYKNALVSANTQGISPDVFVVPANEVSVFENLISGVDPDRVSPNDFRLAFAQNFGEDLIINIDGDASQEYLRGVPAGYEALGFFYNRKYFLRPSELGSWSDINREIKNIRNKYNNIIPLALGTHHGVMHLRNILGAFFVLDEAEGIANLPSTSIKQALGQYLSYGERQGDNGYEALTRASKTKTDIEFFTQGDVAAMIGYPRDLFTIDSIGYQRSFLFVSPFPQHTNTTNQKKVSAEYNFFAMNKETQLPDMAQDFLSFIVSEEGQEQYIETFPYYLSPSLAISAEMREKKILPAYNVVYKNFAPEDAQLMTFDYGDIISFESSLGSFLEDPLIAEEAFGDMRSYITCMSAKHKTLLNLSSPCR